jgi:hypothetical protein
LYFVDYEAGRQSIGNSRVTELRKEHKLPQDCAGALQKKELKQKDYLFREQLLKKYMKSPKD